MMKYEIRQIEAWNDGENNWSWNESFHIANFETNAKNVKKAFLYQLHKLGFSCKRGMCYVYDDLDIMELRNRKTDEPLIAAIPF